MIEGFIVGDGTYAAIPFGKKLMIIYNGQQLDVVTTEKKARDFIQQHKKLNPKPRVRTKPPATQKSQKNEKPTSGQQGSQGRKPRSTKTTNTTPKSKGVPVEKPVRKRKKSTDDPV